MLEALQDPIREDRVDLSMYAFRLVVMTETGDPGYSAAVNQGIWVWNGMCQGADVKYE